MSDGIKAMMEDEEERAAIAWRKQFDKVDVWKKRACLLEIQEDLEQLQRSNLALTRAQHVRLDNALERLKELL